MAVKVTWTPSAVLDLETAVQFIALDSPRYAETFRTEILNAAESLAWAPMRGHRLESLRPDGIREIFEGSYRLLYLPTADEARILAVLHGARNLKRVWKRSAKKRI